MHSAERAQRTADSERRVAVPTFEEERQSCLQGQNCVVAVADTLEKCCNETLVFVHCSLGRCAVGLKDTCVREVSQVTHQPGSQPVDYALDISVLFQLKIRAASEGYRTKKQSCRLDRQLTAFIA